jgi:hypothetical protein
MTTERRLYAALDREQPVQFRSNGNVAGSCSRPVSFAFDGRLMTRLYKGAGRSGWRWPTLLTASLLVVSACVSGCVSSEAHSDLEWQKYNPNWRPPEPRDPRPQWGPFAPP